MDVTVITQLITSVGFPIVVVVFLAKFVKDSYNKLQEDTKEREECMCDIIVKAQDTIKQAVDTNARLAETVDCIEAAMNNISRDIDDIKHKLDVKEE